MDKDEILELLSKWKRHYDAMSERAYYSGNKWLENYSDEMWYYANRLMGRLLRLFKEDPGKNEITLEEMLDHLGERKRHFLEKSKESDEKGNKRSAVELKSLAETSDKMQKRIVTAWNNYRKAKAS